MAIVVSERAVEEIKKASAKRAVPPKGLRVGIRGGGCTGFSYLFEWADTDPRPEGWAAAERRAGNLGTALVAMDYKTGKIRWRHPFPNGGGGPIGLLSTAGKLLFGSDGAGNFVAYDPATGKPLWHSGLAANVSNGPETFLLDGRQFVVVGAGDSLYAFSLQP